MADTIGGSEARLERLVEVGTLLTSELSLEGVLQRVADIARELLNARFGAIGVLSEDGRTLASFTTSGISAAEARQIGDPPQGRGILGLVIREARPIRLADMTTHPDAHGLPPNHPPIHSFLGVPIVSRRGIFGNLYVGERLSGREFTDEDERVAIMLAAQAAAAVDNAKLHEESTRLLEEVQQLHRARERFFATVNHELRNAIAGVYGWAEMLVRKRDPETVPKAAFEVLESAEQAIALINDLLDLSRLDENRLKPRFQDVEGSMVVDRAIRLVRPAATLKQVTVTHKILKTLPTCHTDSQRVEQILVNLLGNAVRHTPPGSTVLVSATVTDDSFILRVEDEGPGIPQEDTERIFDIYYTNSGQEGVGSGLGLPLSRRLARMLGGELRLDNREGGGACFSLHLSRYRMEGGPNMKNPS
jgi:signal transduction histidine kinase